MHFTAQYWFSVFKAKHDQVFSVPGWIGAKTQISLKTDINQMNDNLNETIIQNALIQITTNWLQYELLMAGWLGIMTTYH